MQANRIPSLVLAVAALCSVGADAASADAGRLPDAEVFASNTTAVITDPADPRLDARLARFNREVHRIIRPGGGLPRNSQLVDGVFFSTILGATTFERSREFDVDSVSRRELRAIADRVRRRYHQQSVAHVRLCGAAIRLDQRNRGRGPGRQLVGIPRRLPGRPGGSRAARRWLGDARRTAHPDRVAR
jgi:hypothetical protein